MSYIAHTCCNYMYSLFMRTYCTILLSLYLLYTFDTLLVHLFCSDLFDPDSHTLGKEHHPYGQPFPGHDHTRPLCNVNYQKLVIIIDWKSTTTTATTRPTSTTTAATTTATTTAVVSASPPVLKATTERNTIGNLATTTNTTATTPVDRFDINFDDESYTKHHNYDGSMIDRRSVTLQECLRVFASVDGEELDADTWTCDKVIV